GRCLSRESFLGGSSNPVNRVLTLFEKPRRPFARGVVIASASAPVGFTFDDQNANEDFIRLVMVENVHNACLRNGFGAASRRLFALGPGSHSAFAACARESSGWNWRSVSQQRFPGHLQRSAAEWKAIRDPAQDSPQSGAESHFSPRSPPGEVL
ncbi:MAG: hypothetical protein ACJ8BE_12710, partial [Microvirga sp.]